MKKLILPISILGAIAGAYFLQSFSGGINENSAFHYAMEVNGKGTQVSSTAQSCNICHGGNTATPDLANEGGLTFGFSGSGTYTTGTEYDLNLTVDQMGSKHGYEIIALDSTMNGVGTLTTTTGTAGMGNYTVDGEGVTYPYAKHNSGFASNVFNTKWTAPTDYFGTVTFYAISVSANGDNAATGDDVFYDKLEITSNNVSVQEFDANNFFNISSNNGVINFKTDVELENAKVQVYDVLGKVSVVQTANSNQFSVNTNENNGIVFIRISNGNDVYTSKLKL